MLAIDDPERSTLVRGEAGGHVLDELDASPADLSAAAGEGGSPASSDCVVIAPGPPFDKVILLLDLKIDDPASSNASLHNLNVPSNTLNEAPLLL